MEKKQLSTADAWEMLFMSSLMIFILTCIVLCCSTQWVPDKCVGDGVVLLKPVSGKCGGYYDSETGIEYRKSGYGYYPVVEDGKLKKKDIE